LTAPRGADAITLTAMTNAERDELARLVREIPDEEVPRPHPDATPCTSGLGPVLPHAWFGVSEGDGTAVGARSEELLGEGFGR
jgi:hypothetical protein